MKITSEDIIKLNEAYLLCGTYTGAAKAVGCAPSTAKKYIDPNFKPTEKAIESNISFAPIEDALAALSGEHITELSAVEIKELKALYKEMLI